MSETTTYRDQVLAVLDDFITTACRCDSCKTAQKIRDAIDVLAQ